MKNKTQLKLPVLKTYIQLPVEYASNSFAMADKAVLLSAETKTVKTSRIESLNLIAKVGLECLCYDYETPVSIDCLWGQRSIDSELNTTDFYYAIRTKREKGVHGGQRLRSENVELDLLFSISSENSRKNKGKKFWFNENIRHFSFYSGMHYGLNTWELYRMDYGNLGKVKWDFVKQYAFVQGQIVENIPEWKM
ncbi:MAG: hypothetical protein AABX27_02055 [Nanoarchaeota archaeon]